MEAMVTQQQEIVHLITIYGASLAQLHFADVRFTKEDASWSS
jgi:hypothetical protein